VTDAVWTIGHSTRSIDDFLAVLDAYDIELVADVRRFPGSRRLPQFDSSSLEKSLAQRYISYCWIPELGGRRRASADAQNTSWRHVAFRAYADHMLTEEFASGLTELLAISGGLNTAVMCAEVLWWRCHRRIISDVLTSLGTSVIHIRDATHSELHKIGPPGRIVRGGLVY
jgi:uncharacterized protein (DUF488 family)